MDEDAAFGLVILAFVVSILATILIGIGMTYHRDASMAKLGYRQVMVVGHSTPVWQPACRCDSLETSAP